jgi:hypothetical protein
VPASRLPACRRPNPLEITSASPGGVRRRARPGAFAGRWPRAPCLTLGHGAGRVSDWRELLGPVGRRLSLPAPADERRTVSRPARSLREVPTRRHSLLGAPRSQTSSGRPRDRAAAGEMGVAGDRPGCKL